MCSFPPAGKSDGVLPPFLMFGVGCEILQQVGTTGALAALI